MKKYRIFYAFAVSAAIILSSTACTASAHLKITDKPRYTLSASFIPGDILENAMKNFADPENKAASLFDAQILEKTFSDADISLTDVTLVGAAGLKFTCMIPQTHPVFEKVIRYNRQQKTVLIQLNSEIITNILTVMPDESRDFIDMLAAPIFTGEELSVAEYAQTISEIYGKKLAEGLKKSVFVFDVECPYQITTASITPIGSISTKNKVHGHIEIPLIALLCERNTIVAELKGR